MVLELTPAAAGRELACLQHGSLFENVVGQLAPSALRKRGDSTIN
jgi:hypothetical protein